MLFMPLSIRFDLILCVILLLRFRLDYNIICHSCLQQSRLRPGLAVESYHMIEEEHFLHSSVETLGKSLTSESR